MLAFLGSWPHHSRNFDVLSCSICGNVIKQKTNTMWNLLWCIVRIPCFWMIKSEISTIVCKLECIYGLGPQLADRCTLLALLACIVLSLNYFKNVWSTCQDLKNLETPHKFWVSGFSWNNTRKKKKETWASFPSGCT